MKAAHKKIYPDSEEVDVTTIKQGLEAVMKDDPRLITYDGDPLYQAGDIIYTDMPWGPHSAYPLHAKDPHVQASEYTARAVLPSAAQERKDIPLARGVLDYFPNALAAVAELSRVGNEQHNPGEPMHWAKEKSIDHADCILRHMVDRGTFDTDGVRHSIKVAWRGLAMAEVELLASKGDTEAVRQMRLMLPWLAGPEEEKDENCS